MADNKNITVEFIDGSFGSDIQNTFTNVRNPGHDYEDVAERLDHIDIKLARMEITCNRLLSIWESRNNNRLRAESINTKLSNVENSCEKLLGLWEILNQKYENEDTTED